MNPVVGEGILEGILVSCGCGCVGNCMGTFERDNTGDGRACADSCLKDETTGLGST